MAFLGIAVPDYVGDLLEQVEVPGQREPKTTYHITVVNLGKTIPMLQVAKAQTACFAVCSRTQPFAVSTRLVSSFPGGDDGVPIICPVESPALHALSDDIKAALDFIGVEYSRKFPKFQPHVTLSYADAGADVPDRALPPITWTVSEVVLWGGDEGQKRIVVTLPLEYGALSVAALKVATRHQVSTFSKA